jgi:exodeoxyribonuclease V gamma subunit
LLSRDKPCIIEDSHRSLQIHACHSPIRELEVLQDSLLAFFDTDPHLLPNEIAVMTPDIEKYTPYIRTVFDHPSDKSHYIPYTIADISQPELNNKISDFLSILDLEQKRFSASHVLSILESENIRISLNLTQDDISAIHIWINDTNVKWGIDHEYRESLSLPPTNENTWKSSLDRLLLGYAISEESDYIFDSIVPYSSFDDSLSETFEKFYLFLKRLFGISQTLKGKKTLSQWSDFLFEIINSFFSTGDSSIFSVDKIRKSVSDLREYENIASFSDKIHFPPVRSYLESSLKTKNYGKGFLCGGVTFCNILPMRSIPFKIICLIGLNDGSFPRKDSSVSFNLISMNQRIGDRSLRKEDRYCFLESLLCARKKFYISYIGYNLKDNTPIPPSIIVSELIEYVSNNYRLSHSKDEPEIIINDLITHHTLNGCNPRYFSGNAKDASKYFSYSSENARAISSKKTKRKQLFNTYHSFSEENQINNLTLDQLFSFFSNPIKYLMSHKLGIVIPEKKSLISDSEPFTINGLEKYKLEQKLLERKIIQKDNNIPVESIYSSGILPHGNPGICTLREIDENIGSFLSLLNKTSIKPRKESYTDININLSDINITGRVAFLSNDYLVHYKPAGIKPRDILQMWLSHLLLSLCSDSYLPSKSLLIGMGSDRTQQCYQYSEVNDSSSILKNLLSLYSYGMSRPISFFPAASYIYSYAILKGKDNNYARDKAIKEWTGSRFNPGESDNAYYRIYPGKFFSIDSDFIQTALSVFKPIFEHEKKVSI